MPRVAAESAGGTTGTITRAIQILRLIAESPEPISVTEVASALGLSSSTAHRLLQLLRAEGVVQSEPATRRYAAGVEFVRMARLVADRAPLSDLARPFLTDVVARTGETAQLAVYLPEHRTMTFVDQILTEHTLRFAIPTHEPQPLAWGCSGRVILAHLGDDVIARVIAETGPSPARGGAAAPDAELPERLAEIRRRGWDTTTGEKLDSAVGFAAPVFDARGVIGSVSTPVPTVRYRDEDRDRYVGAVVDAAHGLSRALGGEPQAGGRDGARDGVTS